MTDQQLLCDYAERHSESAFAELVRRYLDLVYSAALRMVRDTHLAEDITQGVFVALAQNARQLTDHPVLSGWLHRTAQNLAANAVRTDVRRRIREQEAATMNELLSAESDVSWEHIAPHLDDALGELNEVDRDALLLRYFENKSLREVGATLGTSDDTAQKRVSRAVERLREFFAKRGVTVGVSGLAVVISANAVQAAPVGLAVTVSTAAALAGTTFVTTATATAIKTIAMTTLQKTLFTVTVAVLAGAGIYEARQAVQLRDQNQTLQQLQAPLAEQIQQLQRERDAATNRLASMAGEMANTKGNNEELLKLRGEIGVLQHRASEASERSRIAEENLATELSAKAQFTKHENATINATKQLDLALRVFSGDDGNQYPTNIAQLAHELRGKFTIDGIDLYSLEFINIGMERSDHPNMVEFRERLCQQAPDGTWKRIYGFADGSVQTATSNDGNFDAWEKANTYSPPPNQNQ